MWSHWRLLSLVSRSKHDKLPAPMLRNLHRHSAGLVKPIMRTYLTQVSIADAWECRIIGDRFVWADGWVWDVQEGIRTRGGLLRRTSRWLAGIKGSLCNNKELELCMSFRRYITFAENCAGLGNIWHFLLQRGFWKLNLGQLRKICVYACVDYTLLDYRYMTTKQFELRPLGLQRLIQLYY